jgi:hypothetical protein
MASGPSRRCASWGRSWCCFAKAASWGLLDRDCPHRGADLSFGRHEPDGLRCPFHGWKFAIDGSLPRDPGRARGQPAVRPGAPAQLPGGRSAAAPCSPGWGPKMALRPLSPPLTALWRRLQPHVCLQGPVERQLAAMLSKWASIRRIPRSCTAFCRMRRWTHRRQRGRQAVSKRQRRRRRRRAVADDAHHARVRVSPTSVSSPAAVRAAPHGAAPHDEPAHACAGDQCRLPGTPS